MATQIVAVNPLQAAKVIGVMYFLVGLIFSPIVIFVILRDPDSVVSSGIALLIALILPFIYAIASFTITPIVCWIYNKVAGRIGGLEITIREAAEINSSE